MVTVCEAGLEIRYTILKTLDDNAIEGYYSQSTIYSQQKANICL